MEFIAHRVNSAEALKKLPASWGAEIDIRSSQGQLILSHDPALSGPSLDEFLQVYAQQKRTGTIIFNPKEDGLEDQIREKAAGLAIARYFFLDLTFPTLVRLSVKNNERRVAVRVSEYEVPDTAYKMAGRVDWVWLDSFNGTAPDVDVVKALKAHFKVCLVSPELQGYPLDRIPAFKPLVPFLDAVCTKDPARWQ